MNINREKAKLIIDEIAVHFARQFQFDKLSASNTHYGIWDEKNLGGLGPVRDGEKEVTPIAWGKGAMSRLLEEQYGLSAITEYRRFSDDKIGYIEVRPRFGNFCIAIHLGKHMGEIEIGAAYPCDDVDVDYLRDEDGKLLAPDENNYVFKQMMAFHNKGVSFCEMLLAEWNRRADNE